MVGTSQSACSGRCSDTLLPVGESISHSIHADVSTMIAGRGPSGRGTRWDRCRCSPAVTCALWRPQSVDDDVDDELDELSVLDDAPEAFVEDVVELDDDELDDDEPDDDEPPRLSVL